MSSHMASVTQISSVIPKIFLFVSSFSCRSDLVRVQKLNLAHVGFFVFVFFTFPNLQQSSSTLSFINDGEHLKGSGLLSSRASRMLGVTFFMVKFRSDFPVRPIYRSHRIRGHIKLGCRWPRWTACLMVMTTSLLRFMYRHIFLLCSNLWCSHGMLYFLKCGSSYVCVF